MRTGITVKFLTKGRVGKKKTAADFAAVLVEVLIIAIDRRRLCYWLRLPVRDDAF